MSISAASSPDRALPVIIIGAGFSGTLLAINLVRLGQPVILVERNSAHLAKGLAFGTARPEHLLNVRARNMRAFPGDPQHFLRWMGFTPPDQIHRFLPRLAYGHYLRSLLIDAMAKSGQLLRVQQGEAADIIGQRDEQVVLLDNGERLHGRAVVLAQGNLTPRIPEALAGLAPGLVFANPWDPAALEGLDPDAAVLLLGSGLTAVDVALSLDRQGHKGPIHVLSRRGLRPRSHDEAIVPVRQVACPQQSGSALVASVRRRAGEVGWRNAVDELRPHTRAIWRSHSVAEQARLIRHLRPWWDVHRHRLAPAVDARITSMEISGRLQFLAGRLLGATPADRGFEAVWKPRGRDATRHLHVDRAIICTGPEGDIAQSSEGLLRRLVERGMARSDPHRLGLDVDPVFRIRDAAGVAHKTIFAVGPVSRGADWETVAVPDIRNQVHDLARYLATAVFGE
ncbi:FAD/NAD(P)-binding protein [Novosphingobium olei]|uniref:FAD/NAD(P)-binding protein n=1 Tax=Novosphingobium olei TaxID=2728851 RepID=UPI003088ED38|nr:FAD/NAD(P)-binding protein [Novosphingobium olei]